jgi:hypothetical protein
MAPYIFLNHSPRAVLGNAMRPLGCAAMPYKCTRIFKRAQSLGFEITVKSPATNCDGNAALLLGRQMGSSRLSGLKEEGVHCQRGGGAARPSLIFFALHDIKTKWGTGGMTCRATRSPRDGEFAVSV